MNNGALSNNEETFEKEKIIKISKGGQITIPKKYYNLLNLDREAVCSIEDGSIVIRPLKREPSEFSTEILKDLVKEGYSGEELIRQFEIASKNIKKAVNNMIEESKEIASGKKKAASFEDVFKED